jgi:carbon-monoxide dehydrogenase medium subunit
LESFEYLRVETLPRALAALAQYGEGARPLCGGTDLIVQLRENRRKAQVVLDIKPIPELNQIIYDSHTGLTIGAAVSCARLVKAPALVEHYPGLLDAATLIGGTQIQGRASLGGNLCNASPAADSIPALIVHDAAALIAGPTGARTLPVARFCVAPGRTALRPDELLVALRLPLPPAGFGAAYLRFIPRNEMDLAVAGVGAAVVLSEDGSRFTDVRLALAAVGPTPIVVEGAGAALAGKPVDDQTIQLAAEMASAAARPIDDVRGKERQRRHLCAVLTRRALAIAIERAKKEI